MIAKMNSALAQLSEKYGFPAGTIHKGEFFHQLHFSDGSSTPLLPWRVERRFAELKKIIDSATLEDVSTFRFASFQAGKNLRMMLAGELDLLAFLSASQVTTIFATGDGQRVCNVIARLANGMSACLECGTVLPGSNAPMDRHEVIARRGVASDRVVDTQIPQSSIYLFAEEGVSTFTDVDNELFGLPDEAIWLVRAAAALLAKPALREVWREQAERSLVLADSALDCCNSHIPVKL